MVYHPRVDWWEGEVASSMIFGIHSPIPVSLNDPQQFQPYLRLYMHLGGAELISRKVGGPGSLDLRASAENKKRGPQGGPGPLRWGP